MGDPSKARTVNSGDSNDPLNYVSFDDYVSGASERSSLQALARRWNAAHPESSVRAHGDFVVPLAAPNTDALVSCGVTRVLAAVQLLGGGLEIIVASGALLAPEPTGATKVVGAVVLLHGVDTLNAAVRTVVSCDRTATLTQTGAASIARFAGASPQTAETIGVVTDVSLGVGGPFAIGSLSRIAPGATQLVHLTSPGSAASIRASETLGLGHSTIYAGPESLARVRGWSILMRTGLNPSQASEVLLLPSAANKSFLMVQPMGVFSGWQRLNGTVFSAGTGVFNLATGTFTRTGIAANQLLIYGIDTAIMATMRVAPAILGPSTHR
jgi:hypothetical protein